MRKSSIGNRFPVDVPIISLAAASVSVNEGQNLIVTINRTGNLTYTSTVKIYTIPGTASEADYTPQIGTLITFAPTDTVKTVSIPISTDALIEFDEKFIVQIANPIMAKIVNNQTLVTITGQVPAITVLSVSSASILEGGLLVHNVALSGNTGGLFTYALTNQTISNTDINIPPTFSNGVTLNAGILNVPTGVLNFSVSIQTVQDSIVEPDETYTLNIGGMVGTGTILNDDVSSTVSVVTISSPTVTEGGTLIFNVVLSGTSQGQSIAFTAGGTATPGTDYATPFACSNGVTISGSNMVIPNGVSGFSVSSITVDDTLVESTETVILTIGNITATGTILDNDAVLTSYAVFEKPFNMMTAGEQAASSTSGGYPAFAVSRDSTTQVSYAVYQSSTIGGTYTKLLDNQPFTPSARCLGSVGFDHRNIAIDDEKDFPASIVAAVNTMLADTAGQQEIMVVSSSSITTIGASTAKSLDNVAIAAMDSVPISVGLDDTARVYLLSIYGADATLRADATTTYYKIVSKDSLGNELSLSLVNPIALTITSRAAKPLPPKNIGFAVTLGNDYVNFPPPSDDFSGYSVYFKASPSSKIGGIYSYDNPSSGYDAGVTVKVAVEGLNGSPTPIRIMDIDTSTGLLTYTQELRAVDGARYSTKYSIYAEKAGVKSNIFTYEIQQNAAYLNVMSSISVAKVAATVEATLITDASFGAPAGTGPETTIAFCTLLGTLITGNKVDTSTITFTAGVEIVEYVGDSNNFYIQIPRSVTTFKIVIPYTTAGSTGLQLEVRVGKIDDYKSAIQTI